MSVPASPEVLARLRNLTEAGARPGQLVQTVAGPGFADSHPDVVAAVDDQHGRERVDPQVIWLQVQAMAGFDSSRLGHVRAPTLIVHGEADPQVPVENGRRLAGALPAARLEILEGVGHLLAHEVPDRYAQLVKDFLTDTSPRDDGGG